MAGTESARDSECRDSVAEAPPVAEEARRFRGSGPNGGHGSVRDSESRDGVAEAPPVAEEARRFRGSGPNGGHGSVRDSESRDGVAGEPEERKIDRKIICPCTADRSIPDFPKKAYIHYI